jgi:hypothetical protein
MSETSRRGLQAAAVVVMLVAAVGLYAVRGPRQGSTPPTSGRQTLIEQYLRRRANDPSSVSIQNVVYSTRDVENGVMTQLARVEFRERNAAGAMVFRNVIVRIENDRDVSHGEWEERFLAIAHSINWSPDPAGPPR